MADEPKETTDSGDELPEELTKVVDGINKRLDHIDAQVAKAAETVRDPRFSIRTGEDIMSSRPYSLIRLAKTLIEHKGMPVSKIDGSHAKIEFELSSKLEKFWRNPERGVSSVLVPFGTDLMPTADITTEEGSQYPGFPTQLVKECADVMRGTNGMDESEMAWIAKNKGFTQLRKDLSAFTSTTGGTLVPMPEQGQLIDLLRAMTIFDRAGAQSITLPAGGSIRFPRDTSDPTIAAYAEAATITESTPGTGELILNAKKYAGLVDVPVELLRYASVSVEGWLRRKFALSLAIQTDAHMVNGQGGTSIKGVISYSGVNTVIATTVASAGDTLGASDPATMLATIENANGRTVLGTFIAFRPRTYNRVTHRRSDSVTAADGAGPYLFDFARGTGGNPDMMVGMPVIRSTNIPSTRVKGASGATLTLVLAGVGPSWIIGRSGVVEIDMTNSDASKFASGINTMRGMIFTDAGPEQEAEFAFIDTLLENT